VSSLKPSGVEINISFEHDRKTMATAGIFLAGTDTDVGKTWVAAAVLRSLRSAGCHVAAYKPVASGFGSVADERSDAWRLWDAAGRRGEPQEVCPQSFAAAIAPPASARAEGREVDEELLRSGFVDRQSAGEIVVVEGAGGLFSTLVVDLAKECALPLVLVDAARLGSIGRSLAAVCAARAEGLRVAAVVLSHTTPPGDDDGPTAPRTIAREAAAEIARRTGLPVVIVDHGAETMPSGIDWRALSRG
jgi:dethiobiotin synthetase